MSKRRGGAVLASRVTTTATAIFDDAFTGSDGAVPNATYWGTVVKSASAIVDINNNQLRMQDSSSGGSTILNETFTGGPALPTGWTSLGSGTVDITSNKLRIVTPAVGYQLAGAYYNPGSPLPQDYDLRADATITTVSAAEFYAGLNFRAASSVFSDIGQHSGWHFRLTGTSTLGVAELYRCGATGTLTWLAAAADIDFVQGTVLHIRVLITGNNIKFRYWKDGAGEPGTWNIDYTDGSAPTGSMISFVAKNGSASAADDWRWDDIVINGAGAALGSYNDYQYLPGVPNVTDFELITDVLIPGPATAEHFAVVGFRGSNTQDTNAGHRAKQTTGYFVEVGVEDNYVKLIRRTGGVDTQLGLTVGIDFQDLDILHLRINAVGSIISFKAWRNDEPEPGVWGTSVTDATYSTGEVWLGHNGGVTTAGTSIRFEFIYAAVAVQGGHGTDTTGGGGGGSSYTDPPIAAAISGMSGTAYKDYNFTTTVAPDFVIIDGDDTPNGERSASKPGNVTFVAEGNTSGGIFMRLAMRRETYAGQPFSGVQMENFFSGPNPGRVYNSQTLKGYGQGSPFYVECRLRWTGFEGFWCGPWMYDLTPPAAGAEIDIMETINTRPPWSTLHSPNHPTQQYAATNDGQWHRYGIRVDTGGIKWYYDNVLVITLTNGTIGSAFVNANMGFKFQAFCGGSWPDADLGLSAGTTPRASVAFPNYFDCDWLRLYR